MQIATAMFGLPIQINDFAAGDVDGDGDVDLLAAGNGGSSRVYWNAGDGTFQTFVDLPAGGRQAALFDVDRDGDLDAFLAGGATAYGRPRDSALFRNDGAATFTRLFSVPPTLVNTASLGVGDIDGDGDSDVMLFEEFDRVRYWRNDGAGNFTDQSTAAFPPPIPLGVRGRLVDLDGDRDLDVITNDGREAYRNSGAGTFAPIVGWVHPLLEVADIDDDGDVDLIAPPHVLLNDGTGLAFTPAGSAPNVRAERAAVLDVDGDGLKDLLGVDDVGRPFLLRNTGGLVFQDVSSTWFTPDALVDRTAGYAFGAACCADFDGDGDPDLVTGGCEGRNQTSTTVGIPPRVFVNGGGMRFVDAGRTGFPWAQDTAAAIAAGDVDADGDVDLVFSYLGYTGYQSAPPTALWKQDATGTFFESGPPPLPETASAAVLVDVDGDGDLDLFGASGSGPIWPAQPAPHRLALNDGAGRFGDVTATHLPASAVSIGASCTAGDVDRDGDVDLVVGSYELGWGGGTGERLMLLKNNGNGVFLDATAQLPTRRADADALALGDFDGDGDLDLMVAAGHYGPMPVSTLMFLNDGSGTFVDATAARLPAVTGLGVDVRDVDADGDLDVVQDGNTLINDGTGNFVSRAAAAQRLLAADFDGDGALEDVIDGYDGVSVGNQGIPWGWRTAGHRALAVDLDHDGDLDLVVSCLLGFSNPQWSLVRIGVLLNQRRDLRLASLPRVGQPYRVQLRAGGSPTLGAAFASPATLTPRLRLPSLGLLALDPSQLFLLGTVSLPNADTTAEFTVRIPNRPEFAGVTLASQALFLPSNPTFAPGLSNAVSYAIER